MSLVIHRHRRCFQQRVAYNSFAMRLPHHYCLPSWIGFARFNKIFMVFSKSSSDMPMRRRLLIPHATLIAQSRFCSRSCCSRLDSIIASYHLRFIHEWGLFCSAGSARNPWKSAGLHGFPAGGAICIMHILHYDASCFFAKGSSYLVAPLASRYTDSSLIASVGFPSGPGAIARTRLGP